MNTYIHTFIVKNLLTVRTLPTETGESVMASLFSWLVWVFVCLFLLLVGGRLCVLVTKKTVIMPGTVSLVRQR